MEKVYQVFVSSTYSDLKDERKRVSDTLAKAGFISVGMELFPATDQQQFEFIKRVIDRSDYYVVIVGGRYGSLADDKVSFTEMEYEYARERKIPVLAFLHRTPEMIPVGKTDQNEDKAARLRRFRDALAEGRLVDFWDDAGDLCTKVTIAVVNAANLTPGSGWVRGEQAIDPRLLQDLELLRAENSKLKDRLADLDGLEVTFDARYAGPETKLRYQFSHRNEVVTSDLSLGDLFVEMYDALIAGPSEFRMPYLIGITTAKAMGRRDPGDSASAAPATVAMIRNHLEALGLIETRPSDDQVRWTVTPKGKRFAAQRKVLPRL